MTRTRLRTALGPDRQRSDLPRWVAPVIVIAIALVAFELLVTVVAGTVDDPGVTISQLLTTAAVMVMVAGFLAGARGTEGEARRAWYWFAAGGLVYLGGELFWGLMYMFGDEPGDVSIADAFWLASFPFYFFALHLRTRQIGRAEGQGEGLLDSLVVMGVFGIVLWEAVLDGIVDPAQTDLETLVAIAYPAADLALLWLVVRNVYRSTSWTIERLLLAVGLVALVVGDTFWALPGDSPLYEYSDVFYVISGVTLGGAGFAAAIGLRERPRKRAERRPYLVDLMPYAAGIAVALVPLWQLAAGEQDLDVAVMAVLVLMLVFVRLAMTVRQNRLMRARAEQAALIDGLTGLRNHRYFQDRLREEIARAEREQGSVGLLMIDIDRFKSVNDTVGHLGGDQLLRELGEALRVSSRPATPPAESAATSSR